MIGEAEGARPDYWTGNPYDLTLNRLRLVVPISQQTLSKVKSTQLWMVKELRLMSGAVGRYQIINKTLKELQKKLALSDEEIFSSEVQDKMAIELLNRRGLSSYLKGDLSLKDFMKNLSKEWASLPNPDTGKSYYGQRTHFTVGEFEPVLIALKRTSDEFEEVRI